MRILFAGGNGWLPETNGGTQNSTGHLIRAAQADGHTCAVLCSLLGNGTFGVRMRLQRKVSGRPFSHDRSQGYDVYRAWDPGDDEAVSSIIPEFRPDVVVVQTMGSARIAKGFADHGIPVVLYLRNVEFDENEGDVSAIAGARYIANSRFTARSYKERYRINCTVIPPTIDIDSYRTHSSRTHATLVNVHRMKGYDLVRDMAAACPDIPFLFVESWALGGDDLRRVQDELRALPNATFQRRTSDMTGVYSRTKVLLAPSQWQEAWGRVASEAHCSGIPVIGSDRGGLPEAIGPGGLILQHDAPVSEWCNALRSLWDDERAYLDLSDAAARYARRNEMNFSHQYSAFMDVLQVAMKESGALEIA